MIKILRRNIFRFLLLIVLQIFIFNNIEIGGYAIPYIYILFILLLPFETPGWMALLLAFFLGFMVDVFSDSLGLHTAAAVLVAFLRPYVLSYFAPREGYESGSYPRVFYYGLPWFLKYSLLLIFVHHLVFFYIEVFNFYGFFVTLLRVVLSTLLTAALIVISQFFIFKK